MMINPWKWAIARMAWKSLALAALAAGIIPAAGAADSIPGLPFKIPGPDSPWAAGLRQDQITPLQLEGRQLVIRAYNRHDASTSAYSGEQVAIKKGHVSIPNKPETIWVAMAADQTDTSVAQALGTAIHILPQSGDWNVKNSRWSMSPSMTLLDALSQPLPTKGLQVTIILSDVREAARTPLLQSLDKASWRITLDGIPTDARGRAELPVVQTESLTFLGYLVSHPDYGTSYFNISQTARSNKRGQMPMVRQGTPARERALSGQVVTADGTPIPEAIIECNSVRTPGGGGFQSTNNSVVCDSQGRFTLYAPNMNPNNEQGDLIPPNSYYSLSVTPPGKFGLLPYVGELSNNDPVRIVLKEGDAFHTFTFETPQGRLRTPDQLARVRLNYRSRAGERSNPIPEEMITKGGKVPFGTYEANYFGNRGEQITYAPVTIDAQSPQAIVFRLPQAPEYHGRVIDGSTGRPLAGAFVIGMTSTASGSHLTDLSPGQWDAMHALPQSLKLDDKALEPLRKIYMFTCATRTAADGSWSMTDQTGGKVYAVIAFDQYFVSFEVRVHMKKPDGQNQITVPTMKLYLAARVTIKPVVKEATIPGVSISPRWVIDKDNPGWATEMIPWINWNRQNEGQFGYDGWMRANAATTIEVPAGVKLKVKLETPYNETIGDLVIPTDIYLQQGETKDLGVQEMPHDVLIAVQATDEAGSPVEGLPLRLKQERGWGVAHNTDANGVALLYVPAGRQTQAGTLIFDTRPSLPKEYSTPVQATGKEKEPPIFTLKLPREVIKKALESRIPISNR